MTGPKILFDTNAFIACEDVTPGFQHENAEAATSLKELAQRHDCELYLHPATKDDIDRATDSALREANLLKMRQWKHLGRPALRNGIAERAGYGSPLSQNDATDLEMLAALDSNAVELLITEDRRLRRHSVKAGFGDRTLTLQGGIEYLKRLYGEVFELPAVERKRVYELPGDVDFFESLREDYEEFDDWFARISREHRECFVMLNYAGLIDALAIIKIESNGEHGISGHSLKVCTFKVAPHAGGGKRGELILRAVFLYASERDVDQIYVEVLPSHEGVVVLFEMFGFKALDRATARNELILVKSRRPTLESLHLEPFEYHRTFGPPAVMVKRAFVVPIRPAWHEMLFPESRFQGQLLEPDPFGNAILKAYLCRANIVLLKSGDLLLFYRSHDLQSVSAIGVVESTARLNDPSEIRQLVGLRTVYPDDQIRALCNLGGSVLAILFRHDRFLSHPWTKTELINNHVLSGAPQSIQQVTNEGALEWLRHQLNAPH